MSKDEFIEKYPNCELVSDTQRLNASNAGHKSMIKQWNDPVFRDKMIRRNCETLSNARNNPKVIEKKISRLKEVNRERLKTLWKDDEYREKMSDKMKVQHSDPNGKLKKSIIQNSGKKRYTFYGKSEIHMRSKWEVKFARWLTDNSIDFEYESKAFKYEYNNSKKIYYPDFYLPKYDLYCEVKPKAFISDLTNAKAEAVKCDGHNFMYITENELSNLDNLKF